MAAGPRRRPSIAWALLIVLLLACVGLGATYAVTHRGSSPPRAAAGPAPPAVAPALPASSGATTTVPTQPPTTAAPPPATVVPRVLGYQAAAAVAMLRRAGLVGAVKKVASVEPDGRVVGQNPRAGTKEAKSSRVELDVAVQPLVSVPGVVGMSGLVASHTLTADHLVPSLRYVPSSKPPRTVVAQYPTPGTKLKRGSHVQINVSSGGGATGATGAG